MARSRKFGPFFVVIKEEKILGEEFDRRLRDICFYLYEDDEKDKLD